MKLREIAEHLGWTIGHTSKEFDRLRNLGYDLPYRRSAAGLQNMRNAGRRRRKA
jgi:hypothetical protein